MHVCINLNTHLAAHLCICLYLHTLPCRLFVPPRNLASTRQQCLISYSKVAMHEQARLDGTCVHCGYIQYIAYPAIIPHS